MAKIIIDKINKQVIFKCTNKADMKLVLDRYIVGCKKESADARASIMEID